LRADLVLVAGDPTTNIADTLTIKKVWKRGSEISGVAVGWQIVKSREHGPNLFVIWPRTKLS
jgi:hypothetical protein